MMSNGTNPHTVIEVVCTIENHTVLSPMLSDNKNSLDKNTKIYNNNFFSI